MCNPSQKCRVIGFAGSEEKCQWIRDLGADYAFNYKNVNVSDAIKEAAPDGIDCYFDNVSTCKHVLLFITVEHV